MDNNNFQPSEAEDLLLEKTRISAKHIHQIHKIVSEIHKNVPTTIKRALIMSAVVGFLSGLLASLLFHMVY